MKKNLKLVGLAITLLIVASCAKSEPAAPATGPELKPPAADNAAPQKSAPPTDAAPPAESTPPTEEKQAAAIGAPAPAWANLEGTDGKTHSLRDLVDVKAVVVVFTCNHCPFAKAYEDRLVEFENDYKQKGVELVAINVSNIEEDKLPAMNERAKEKSFNFPYIYDPSQNIAREYGATNTPHAFVLDKDRKIVYMGAIDDNENDASVTKHYVRDAVDAALAGKTPETENTRPVGCSILYD